MIVTMYMLGVLLVITSFLTFKRSAAMILFLFGLIICICTAIILNIFPTFAE